MAGLSAREQFSAVAWLRWRVFVNGLRSKQRTAEAISGVFMFLLMLGFGFGPAIGFGFGSYYALASGEAHLLPLFLWLTFLYWQFFPAVAIAVSEVFDTSTFLRFPVSLPMYYALWLGFGSLDPALVVPILWLAGMFVGIAIANITLVAWAAVVLLSFALMNLLLSRLINAYIERWMSRRKTREIVGALLAFVGIGFQLVTRLVGRYANAHRHSPLWHYGDVLQQLLPPGIAAKALALANHGQRAVALEQWGFLLAYTMLFGGILGVRLRAQYFGENLSETSRRGKVEKRERAVPVNRGWLALPDPIGAIFEKELRTLFGARQLWIILLAPPVMLLVFGKMGSANSPLSNSQWTLPVGAAYGLLTLGQFFCNCFSGELAGIQFLYLAPVSFRQIILGKNLANAVISAFQFLLVLLGVTLFFSPPRLPMLILTITTMLFAVVTLLSAGNLLSLYFPKKVDLSRVKSRQGSSAAGLIMYGLELAVVALAAPLFVLTHFSGSIWFGIAGFVALTLFASIAYWVVLGNMDALALRKRETLIAEFTKTS